MNSDAQSSAFSFHDASRDTQLNITPSQEDFSSTYTPIVETERIKVIWGTTINVQETADRFKEFIRKNKEHMKTIEQMNTTQEFIFNLSCENVDEDLVRQLSMYPQEALSIFQNALQDIYTEMFPSSSVSIQIRPFNIGKPLVIRNINPADIDSVVQVVGMVVRCSCIIPELVRAFFRCLRCGAECFVESVRNVIDEPVKCTCGGRYTHQLVHNMSEFEDKQIVKVQELPEGIQDGAAPMGITVVCREDLVDKLVPGDRVVVIGILKAAPVRLSSVMKKIRSPFRIYINMLSHQTVGRKVVNKNIIDEIDKLRRDPNVYEKLSSSIAPSVYGMEDTKKALLLQLFGGVMKELSGSRLRGDINILLAGDPGISKSQLLCFMNKICDRGIYTSGKGSSAVGLTASVMRDHETGQFILEPGALVLSDNGICCIDEFDKMNDNIRSVLHEVMEQQTVSVAKAGIITTLNARSSILASCNPIESKYNPKKSIVENINLPSTLLSRFDVVCLLIDGHNETHDREVGDHIVSLYSEYERFTGYVSVELLKEYVKEARRIFPKLMPESTKMLIQSYVDLRQLDNGKTITATARQLESLIRLSEAHARMRFSGIIEEEDVREAVRIVKESILMYAVDPSTGKVDMEMIITGKSASKRRILESLKESILLMDKQRITVAHILKATGIDERTTRMALEELVSEEKISISNRGDYFEKI